MIGTHFGTNHVDQGALSFFRQRCDSFLDVGCGPGWQVDIARHLGYKALGLDGDISLLGPSYLLVCDFTKNPIRLPMEFDLVWSVEVAEHIPEEYEPLFLETCTYNCGRYLVLTASQNPKPQDHVNVKSREYWIRRIIEKGFILREDLLKGMLEKSTMVREFLRVSGMVFERAV